MPAENFALVQRPAPYRHEAMTLLAANVQETPPIVVPFPRPVIITGMRPTIALAGGSNVLPFPTYDDLLVSIEVETGTERRLTSRFDVTTQNGIGALPNVTLASFFDSVGSAHVMRYDLGAPGSRPDLQITFAWKRPIAGGPYFQNIFVGLTLYYEFKDG